jgi:predicted nucleic acid-binding Zn finger protein
MHACSSKYVMLFPLKVINKFGFVTLLNYNYEKLDIFCIVAKNDDIFLPQFILKVASNFSRMTTI